MLWQRKLEPWGENVAQLVEHRTVMPLTQVRFPGAASDAPPRVNFSMQTLLRVSIYPRAQSHALTTVRTLKILLSMSEFGGLWQQ